MAAALREPVVFQALGAVRGRVGVDLGPDRVAAEDDLLLREESFHPVVGHADAVDAPAQDLVGQPGKAVLLLDQGGNVPARGLPEQGGAGIAAHAHGDVRLEAVDDLAGLAQAARHLGGDAQVVADPFPVQLALEPGDGQAHDFVAGGRDLLHLHPPFGADEEDFGLRIGFPEFAGDRDGGEDVAARAAAADDDA